MTTESEEIAQGPYVAAWVGLEPSTFRTESTEPHHWADNRVNVSDIDLYYDTQDVWFLQKSIAESERV